MLQLAAAGMATWDRDAGCYQRHRPEQTLLYQIVEEYYPAFMAHMVSQGRDCQGVSSRSLKTASGVAVSNMAFARAAGRDAWPKVKRC